MSPPQAHTPWQVAELGIEASYFCKKISPPHPTFPASYWETGFQTLLMVLLEGNLANP